MSATPVPVSTSSPTSTDLPLPTATKDHATLRVVATIIPIVVIVAIVIWGMLVAAGVMQHRRGSPGSPVFTHQYHEKHSEQQEEPKLWEVRTETIEAKPYLEELNPLSVELCAESSLTQKPKRSWSLRKKENMRSKRRWKDFVNLPYPELETQNARVTVLVAMPTPNGGQPGQPLRDFAIGTQQVIYTTGDEKRLSKASYGISGGSSSTMEMPILLDLCAHGYIG